MSVWALVLGGPVVALGGLAATRPEYNASSLPIDRYINAVDLPLLFMGLLLLSVGFTGLLVQYGNASGAFGRFSLGLAIVSGVTSATGCIGLSFNNSSEIWWYMFFLGLTTLFLCAILFGVVCLQRKVLPRWNGLPLVGFIWLPLLYGLVPGWVSVPLWLLSVVGLVAMGYLLQSDTQPTGTAPAAV